MRGRRSETDTRSFCMIGHFGIKKALLAIAKSSLHEADVPDHARHPIRFK